MGGGAAWGGNIGRWQRVDAKGLTKVIVCRWTDIFKFIWLPLCIVCAISLAVCLLVHFAPVVVFVPQEVPVALGAVMGLLLAFRLNASYSRWWEGRLLWGNIILR